VLKIDKFGNIITNIKPQDAPALFRTQPPPFKIMVGSHEVTTMHPAYAHGAPGEVFGLLGSMGFLEVAANRGSAAELLKYKKAAMWSDHRGHSGSQRKLVKITCQLTVSANFFWRRAGHIVPFPPPLQKTQQIFAFPPHESPKSRKPICCIFIPQ